MQRPCLRHNTCNKLLLDRKLHAIFPTSRQRCAPSVKASSGLTLLNGPRRSGTRATLKVLPRIQYSDSIKELDYEELLGLLQGADIHTGDPDLLLDRLMVAVANSLTVVVATVMEDKLPSYQPAEQQSDKQQADDWSWVTARRKQKKKKVLAGFARAMGDGALVATVHDLAVLPELQGLGLGRKLLAKVTSQILNKTGTTDVGLASPCSSFDFFNSCGFDLDREESTFMTLVSRSTQTPVTHQLQASSKLTALLCS